MLTSSFHMHTQTHTCNTQGLTHERKNIRKSPYRDKKFSVVVHTIKYERKEVFVLEEPYVLKTGRTSL